MPFDRHTAAQRSYNMSRIRKFGNASTEQRMIRLFREYGIKGWRRHLALPGCPDFTFRRQGVAIFVDGCFWHCCPTCNWVPKSNTAYWAKKLARNMARDRDANRGLIRSGWRVIRVWEHTLKNSPGRVAGRVLRALSDCNEFVQFVPPAMDSAGNRR